MRIASEAHSSLPEDKKQVIFQGHRARKTYLSGKWADLRATDDRALQFSLLATRLSFNRPPPRSTEKTGFVVRNGARAAGEGGRESEGEDFLI